MAAAFDFACHVKPTKCSLYYIDDKHKTEKPFFRLDEPFNAERQRTNIQINRHDDNTARDIRGLEHLLNFERDGLEIHKFQTMMTERVTPKDALECYRSEIAALLHSRFKTETVVFYDCMFRKRALPGSTERSEPDAVIKRRPATTAHVDQTTEDSLSTVEKYLSPDMVKQYRNGKSRIRIINAWRVLNNPLDDHPLAFCDYFSVGKQDLVATTQSRPGDDFEIYYVTHNPEHRWYWLSQQTAEELAIFKTFDSHPGNEPAFIPHAALSRPDGSGAFTRESVEVRCLLVNPIGTEGYFRCLHL